jgi:hypothetical protein
MPKLDEIESKKSVSWTPQDYLVLLVTSSACLCLLILVLGVVLGVLAGAIRPDQLGTLKSAGVGGGFIGLAMVLYQIIKVALREGRKS